MWVYHRWVSARAWRGSAGFAGVELIAWTVDDAARMRKLVDQGVDGICSNDPRLFADLPAERRLSSPDNASLSADLAGGVDPQQAGEDLAVGPPSGRGVRCPREGRRRGERAAAREHRRQRRGCGPGGAQLAGRSDQVPGVEPAASGIAASSRRPPRSGSHRPQAAAVPARTLSRDQRQKPQSRS